MSCSEIFKNARTRLTKTEQTITDYIAKNSKAVTHMSVQELASRTGTSTGAVIRMTRKLGFDGFPEFKIELAKSEFKVGTVNNLLISSEDSVEMICKKLCMTFSNTVEELTQSIVYPSLEKLAGILKEKDSIYLHGIGGSAIPAMDLQEKIMRINKRVIFHMDAHVQMSSSVHSTPDDVVIVFSYGGETKEINCAVETHKKNGAYIIGITRSANTTLSKMCDFNFFLPNTEGELRLGAISSRFAQLIAGDILYLLLVRDDFEKVKSYITATRKIVKSI